MDKETVLISACLLGVRCRFDADSKREEKAIRLAERVHLVPICPEQLGGLSTPRPRHELVDGKVLSEHGVDGTEAFARGAAEALKIAKLLGCRRAILKARSPSCGKGEIYDGTFGGVLVKGNGVLASRLIEEGFVVETEDDL